MAEWVESLKSKRARILEAGSLHGSKRAAKVLTRMRAGTLDWRATLDARAHDAARRGAASRLGTLQRRMLTQLDELLLRAGEALSPEQKLPAPSAPLPPVLTAEEARPDEQPRAPEQVAAVAPAPAKTKKRASAKRASKRAAPERAAAPQLPIEGYDKLTAKQIVAKLRGLDDAAREQIRVYEGAKKARKTVLRALS